MTIDEMMKKKKEYGFSCDYIASESGVPVSTVRKIFSGVTPTPRQSTLEALRNFFEKLCIEDHDKKEPGKDMFNYYDKSAIEDVEDINYVCEDETPYWPTNGTGALKIEPYNNKTIADYLALPEGVRVELIDGVFYDMAAPTSYHQRIGYLIEHDLDDYIDSNNGECVPFNAPVDVQLDCDDKTMVQPDVLVVCDRKKITGLRIVGAPDLIVEVMSESNWYHDTQRKLWKYKNAGVREYWIVMPRQMKIRVYYFEKSDIPKEYTFNDEVPVGIWGGKCKVDFKKIYKKISFMMES